MVYVVSNITRGNENGGMFDTSFGGKAISLNKIIFFLAYIREPVQDQKLKLTLFS